MSAQFKFPRTGANIPFRVASSVNKEGVISVSQLDRCDDFDDVDFDVYKVAATMVVNTMDAEIRRRLIELGWTPPRNAT